MRRRAVTILCMLLQVLVGLAQQSMQVTHLGLRDGLSHNSVYCSLKARDGFLWFGTWYGLTRFDGAHFDNYSKAFVASSDQPPRKVESIAEDGNGNLWIKTLDWKLSLLYSHTERFEDIFDELKPYTRNLQVIKIQSDGHGHVLLLTKDKNLLLASTAKDGKVIIRKLVDAQAYVNHFNYQLRQPIVQLREGRANYVGLDYQIYSIPLTPKTRRWTLAMWQRYFAQAIVQAQVYHTPNGLTWQLSADKSALVCTNPATGFERRYPLAPYRKLVEPKFVATAKHGYFYLSAAGEILHIDAHTLEGQNIALLQEFTDFKENSRFFSMQLDRDGLLWITSASNGIYRINFTPNQFRLITLPNGDVSGVRALFQLSNGNVLVGTRSKNLYVFSREGKLIKTLDYARSHIGSVYHVMQDRKGRLWLSTKGDGLVMATPDASFPSGYRFEHYRHDAKNRLSISGNNVYISYQDSHGRIWVGTLDGGLNLVQESPRGITFANKYNGMRYYPGYGLYMDVRNMVEDSHGRMWVGTIDGLMSFDGNFKSVSNLRFETYRLTDINTRANSDVYALYKDHRNHVWLCTFGGGLSRLEGFDQKNHLPRLQSLGAKEGLLNDVILSVLEDKHGRLWLVNADGLSCYDYQAGRIRYYDNSDGFPAVQMEESSSMLKRNGEIWLGCKEGILAFYPDQLHQASVKYPIYIIGGEVNNQDIRGYVDKPILDESIVYADHLELKHSQSMFTLQFAALNFANPERISYRYKLEGYDHDWHYSGVNRIASYTNVPSGSYTFVVEAIDATNPDQHSTRSLHITILPPWWATWWAYLIYIVLLVAAIYAAVRYARYHIRVKNDIYIQNKLAEYKRKFSLEQQDKQFLDSVQQIIADNLTNSDFEIEVISQQMGMSRSAFFKKVKAITGVSPNDLVKDYKLNQAVELLKHSDLSITDVAYRCGFNDVGYFGKCFRKKYGMSPREFVTSQTKQNEK